MKRLNDLQAFYEELMPVRATPGGEYTPEDRYRDFQAVFLSDDRGKRVLAQILREAEGPPIVMDEVSEHSYLAARAGMRLVGHTIIKWINDLPPDVVIESEDYEDG